MKKTLLACLVIVLAAENIKAQSSASKNNVSIIAYYFGDATSIDAYPVEKLTHIIFSFCHLKENKLNVDDKNDSLTIQHLVTLKKRNPSLKVILSLGGWGGCETCSEIFSSSAGRNEFAQSVKQLNEYFKTDGIDLDWEYPAIAGYEGHRYTAEDKHNFTLLVETLRNTLGNGYEISFAAGGFTEFMQNSIEWDKVMPLVDKVNLMTYDMVHDNSKVSGHHTPLYSTAQQKESVDNTVRYLDSIGVPENKMVIGAAFYGRIFDVFTDANNGLFQSCKFSRGISYKKIKDGLMEKDGFTYYWDEVANAPYMYAASKKQFMTFDDAKSIALKTKYVLQNNLNGIMFWQLGDDAASGGLLDVIYDAAGK